MDTPKKVYRVAVIGCGSISANHVNAIIKSGNTLCALCDVNYANAKKLMDKFGLENLPVYENYQKMIDEVRPDSVHVCTPHYLHAEMTVYALEKGVNVLCEKPVCMRPDELDTLRRTATKSSAKLGVCQQNRYEKSMLTLKELCKDGVSAAFGHVVWKRDADYYLSGEWRGKWDTEGGGVMINQALHTLDIMQWLCGMPDFVTANVSNDHLKDVIEVEDTACALFEYENKPSFNFFATTSADASFPVMIRLRLPSGDFINAENDLITQNGNVIYSTQKGEVIGKSVWGMGHLTLIKDFYRCLTEGEDFPIGLEEAEKVVRLILSMYKSCGKKIPVIN